MKKRVILLIAILLGVSNLHADAIDINQKEGEVSLEVNGKKILKGAFTAMFALTDDFNTRDEQDVESFIWFTRNIVDVNGDVHDLIAAIDNGKLVTYFPINNWLLNQPKNIGRVLFGLLYLHDKLRMKESVEINKETIESLVRLQKEYPGKISTISQEILGMINGNFDQVKRLEGKKSDSYPNPFAEVDLQGTENFLCYKGHQIKKGSVALFLKGIEEFSQNETESKKMITETAEHLINLGFFQFFNQPDDWTKGPALEAKQFAFTYYLEVVTAQAR